MEIRLRSAGLWGLGLAVFYAVFVRFYQAAGGRIGLPARITEPERMQQASYVAGLVVLVGGITIDKPLLADPTPAVRAADAWWNIAFYGPWFAAMGACLLLSAAAYA